MRSPPVRKKDETKTKIKKRNQKGYKAKELQQITCSQSGRGKKTHTGMSSFVCYFGHMWLIACHTVRRAQTPSNRHTWQLCAPKSGHIIVQKVPGGCTVYVYRIYIEHVPATCIPWSWNTAEILLLTHTLSVHVCVSVCFPFHSAGSCESYFTAYIATEKDLVSV